MNTKDNYFARMIIYFKEMFPLITNLISAFLFCSSFNFLLRLINGINNNGFSFRLILGSLTVFFLTLILRLMDELKDKEIDKQLFSKRPLPSAKVKEEDIKLSLLVVIALVSLLNLIYYDTYFFFILLLGYSILMYKFFFIPKILRKYLLLNLATHNPIVAVLLFYLLVLLSGDYSTKYDNINWFKSILLILMFWSLMLSWEISRKIRSREEENEYMTYSRIFGGIGSTIIVITINTLIITSAAYFYLVTSVSLIYLSIIFMGYTYALYGNIKFILHPNSRTSKIKHFTIYYILSIFIATVGEQIFNLFK